MTLVVAAQLPLDGQGRAQLQRYALHEPLAQGNGQQVLRAGQARHGQRGVVELLPEHFMAVGWALTDYAAKMQVVPQFLHDVSPLLGCVLYSSRVLFPLHVDGGFPLQQDFGNLDHLQALLLVALQQCGQGVQQVLGIIME